MTTIGMSTVPVPPISPSGGAFTWVQILYLSLSITLGVVIAFGNVMTVIVICQREILQTVSNKFILSLAVTDLLICVGIIFDAAVIAGADQVIPCLVLSLWDATSLLSLICLVLIAADRLVYVSRPLHYHLLITSKRANAVIAISWLIGFSLFAFEMIWSYWNTLTNSCDEVVPPWFRTTMTIAFCTLICIMLLLYGLLIRLAMRQRKRIADSAQRFTQTVTVTSNFRFLKRILSIVMFSLACWIPYLILQLIELIWKQEYISVAWMCIALLFYLNSAVNFFIYASRDKEFYNAYKLTLSCRL